MQIKCPCCNAAFPLESALAIDAGRSALLLALRMPAPVAALLAQYLGMFRAHGRALSFVRVEKLLQELLPMIEAASVARHGVARPCAVAHWQVGLERMVEARDAGKLTLPLKSHGYLLEIVSGLADAADAQRERARETALRNTRQRQPPPAGADADATAEATAEATARRLVVHDKIQRIKTDQFLGLIDETEATRRIAAIREPRHA